MENTLTAPAPDAAAPAPAQAPVDVAPVAAAPAAPVAAPALTPEQDAQQKQLDAQMAVQKVIKDREDKAAAEISAICEKYGCELIVGHSVKVRFKNQPQA